MATKANNSGTLKKEKKVTPSSNSYTIHRQGPKCSIPAGSTDNDKATISGLVKPIPNYLKPTFSSRCDSFTYLKKPTGHEDPSTQKHTLLRRRSFDRPPSASHVQKSLISPDPKDRAGSRDRTVTVRSTPISLKPAALDRTSRLPSKPVRSQTSPAARPIKRSSSLPRSTSTSTSTKNEHKPYVSFKNPCDDHDVTHSSAIEIEHESSKESVVPEVEETLNVEREELAPFNVPKAENKEEADALDTRANNDEEEKLTGLDISIFSEGKNEYPAAQNEETEKELFEEDIERENENEGEGNHSKDEGCHAHPIEDIAEAKVEADQEEAGENKHENVASSEKPVYKKKDEDIKVDEGSEELDSKERQDVVNGVEEAKPEAADMAQKRQVTGQGNSKKESPGAYNDVIEETKNKLLEKRKNKVKALVGAFETVIDYESSSK